MLKKVKIKLAAVGITGIMGAGSLFSGIAAQNVYAREDTAVGSVIDNKDDSGNTDISGQINETQDSYSDTSADTLQSVPITEVNEGNTVSESPEQNSTAIENDTETESSKDPVKESTTGSETQNDDNAKEYSGTGAIKDTKAVEAKKNGWVKVKGGYKYYKNGKAYTGWHKMGKAEGEKKTHWSYFGKNGVMYTGWKKMGKVEGEKTAHWCYFGSNGWLRTGWVKFGKGTANPDGNVKKHWSYFGSNGWLRTGWVQFGKGTSEPDGNTAKHWSYFGSNGWLRTGWVQFGKGTSEPDGNVAKHWSYFGENGWMRTGWQEMGKGTKNPDGNSAKHTSYFGSNGWMRTGNHVIDGVSYTFNNRGWLNAHYENGKLFTGFIIGDGTGIIDGIIHPCGTAYKNGQRFTGTLEEFPETFEWVIYDSYGKSIDKHKKNDEYHHVEAMDKIFINGWGIGCNIISSRKEVEVRCGNNDYYGGVKVTVKIGSDTYESSLIRNNGYGTAKIYLKKNYPKGQKYTVIANYGGKSLSYTDTVKW